MTVPKTPVRLLVSLFVLCLSYPWSLLAEPRPNPDRPALDVVSKIQTEMRIRALEHRLHLVKDAMANLAAAGMPEHVEALMPEAVRMELEVRGAHRAFEGMEEPKEGRPDSRPPGPKRRDASALPIRAGDSNPPNRSDWTKDNWREKMEEFRRLRDGRDKAEAQKGRSTPKQDSKAEDAKKVPNHKRGKVDESKKIRPSSKTALEMKQAVPAIEYRRAEPV